MTRRRRRPKIIGGRVVYRLTDDALDAQLGVFDLWSGRVDPANADVYDPKPNQIVPKDGAFAMIVRDLPPLEFFLHEKATIGRVFWVDHHGNADDEGFTPDGTYKVTCFTPWHELTLWPYEYTVISSDRLIAYWQDGTLRFHPMTIELGRLNDIVFYARSRGIGIADALPMALGSLKGPVGWFEPHPDLADDLAALARRINTPLWKHIQDHPRGDHAV